jgi:tRNA dimethylallyltransferase
VTAPPVLALVGPTASGKSAVALAVARGRRAAGAAPVELVAADAFTLYRGMDVATAKPSHADRSEVSHHLVDELDPSQDATVAWFQQRARAVIDGIHDRGHVPLLVGGSGLYLRAVVDHLRFPPTDPEVRTRLERRYEHDPRSAHEQLRRLDPDAAAKVAPDNLRRSVRALEVIELTGGAFSAYDDGFERYESRYAGLSMRGLEVDRDQLRQRITARARAMVDRGLLDEAARLREGDLSRTARQAIGYAEAFAVLDGTAPIEGLVPAIVARTWRYARRQLGWLRRDPRIRWSAAPDVVRAWTSDAD